MKLRLDLMPLLYGAIFLRAIKILINLIFKEVEAYHLVKA